VINDLQSAIDLMMTVKYETGIKNIVLSKELVVDKFFILTSGLAGEILQKFINYQFRIAIYDDYSNALINFFIIAFSIFLALKYVNKINKNILLILAV